MLLKIFLKFHIKIDLISASVATNINPKGRIGQASVLFGDKLYFFGGRNLNFTDQVFYLNLSSSFSILSPPWKQVTMPIPIPLSDAMSCLSTDGSTILLVGGLSQSQLNASDMLPPSSVYAFNFNNLQWTAQLLTVLPVHF
ncbi:galactose oxidase [Gigaspora margarita]|uniref:Galactose oxidase n=1 Tax=Gigaspora margarita TaxID=4874 RepID=A0A8H3XH36_GIGMA|nr:galactose oxidase [Gigaspora margarita]